MARYVALLRGINVGGKNIIKMKDLRATFEESGYEDVVTYIQSGNVIFSSPSKRADLTKAIEAMLTEAFDYQASVMIRSRSQMEKVVEKSPKGFGTDKKKYRYDVIFLRDGITPKKVMAHVDLKPGVDQADAGTGVLYFRRLIAKASQSRLIKLASLPIYQSMTVPELEHDHRDCSR